MNDGAGLVVVMVGAAFVLLLAVWLTRAAVVNADVLGALGL